MIARLIQAAVQQVSSDQNLQGSNPDFSYAESAGNDDLGWEAQAPTPPASSSAKSTASRNRTLNGFLQHVNHRSNRNKSSSGRQNPPPQQSAEDPFQGSNSMQTQPPQQSAEDPFRAPNSMQNPRQFVSQFEGIELDMEEFAKKQREWKKKKKERDTLERMERHWNEFGWGMKQ